MIEVQNLEKKFGDFVAVDKINFSLQSGDILGFLGPNIKIQLVKMFFLSYLNIRSNFFWNSQTFWTF